MEVADIALIGLAVMGENLALNLNDHGYKVVVYNRTVSKVDDFLRGSAKGSSIIGSHSLKELVGMLKPPRRLILMVKAGEAVDQCIDQVVPLLSPGDIIIDGGNSLYSDTARRCCELKERGILFVGAGISGGEEGARYGPSIMPGGNSAAWPHLKEMLQSIAAKADNGEPCCDWVGDQGAGHYVKMIHNGIEYGDMQLICEAYAFLKEGLALTAKQMQEVFSDWNNGELNSYLIEITGHILGCHDSDGTLLIDKILDVAGQKGTGKWTVNNALELGMPLTLIGEAVFSRCLSALKGEREEASKRLSGPTAEIKQQLIGDKGIAIERLRAALYAAKIISYSQGFMLMRQAGSEYRWQLNYSAIALMWRGGCIIRSRFLDKISEAFEREADLSNLMLSEYFSSELSRLQQGLRDTVAKAAQLGIALPSFSSALSFYDGYRSERLPANLLQAQRDYFGAHTYERIDRPRGEFHHTDWVGMLKS